MPNLQGNTLSSLSVRSSRVTPVRGMKIVASEWWHTKGMYLHAESLHTDRQVADLPAAQLAQSALSLNTKLWPWGALIAARQQPHDVFPAWRINISLVV